MTDQQILIGIMQNDERAWKHICRNMKQGFVSILAQTFSFGNLSNEDIEDVFQESCILLMQKIKSGGFAISREGALFSYLVQIGKLTACNIIRKRKDITTEDVVTISDNTHKEHEDRKVRMNFWTGCLIRSHRTARHFLSISTGVINRWIR